MLARTPERELMDGRAEAEAYANADFAEVNVAFCQQALELAGERPTCRVLDLGTGPADIPVRLYRARPHWRVTALDGSAAMLELARARLARDGLIDRIKLVHADALASGLPDESFDLIVSNSLLHHVRSAIELWREMARLADRDGLVFVRDLVRPPTRDQAESLVATYAGSESPLLQKEFFHSLLAAYTTDEVRAQLAASGLAHLEVALASDRHLDVAGRVRR